MRALILGVGLIASGCYAQSLADAAKEQKKYHEELKAAGIKIETYGLKGEAVPAAPDDRGAVSVMGAQTQPIAPVVRAPASERVDTATSQLARRVDTLRAEIARLQKDVDLLSTVNGRHVEYGIKKNRLERLQSELATLEEQARKAGLPPGVVR